MLYKDPEKRREAVQRHRARRGQALGQLAQDALGLPEPPSRDYLLRALGVEARKGNTAAIRLLLEEYRRDGNDNPAPVSFLDELRERREQRSS